MRYNRHYDRGFTRVFTNDLYNIEERIQNEVDPDIYIMWNPNTGQHLVMDDVTNLAIMSIPQIGFEELDSRLIPHLRKIKVGEDYDPFKELEQSNQRKEQASQKKLDDVSDYFSKEVAKAL